MFTFTLIKKKNRFGEYVVRCKKDGVYYPDGYYFTTDWMDAINTLKDMQNREKKRCSSQLLST